MKGRGQSCTQISLGQGFSAQDRVRTGFKMSVEVIYRFAKAHSEAPLGFLRNVFFKQFNFCVGKKSEFLLKKNGPEPAIN